MSEDTGTVEVRLSGNIKEIETKLDDILGMGTELVNINIGIIYED